MLQRRTSSAGIVFYISPLLENIGVPHAVSTRVGGVSSEPFASLNLGNPSGQSIQDSKENISRNYQLLQLAIGLGDSRHCYVHQVHGCGVVSVNDQFTVNLKADALVTNDSNDLLSVRVADCTPILIATPDGKAVAAVHAGWKGNIAGVIQQTVNKLLSISPGTQPSDLTAAIGPCIGYDAFEVSQEVLKEFKDVFGDDAPIRHEANNKGRVDLKQAARLQLIAAGLKDEQIDITDRCTVRDRDEFFSHRRDNGLTGRMAALIAPVQNVR